MTVGCGPAVQVEGEPALRERVAAVLRGRGVEGTAREGCPVTRVRLQGRDGAIAVVLVDEARRANRTVADADTAISLIESWVRSDLSAPLLAALMGPAMDAVPGGGAGASAAAAAGPSPARILFSAGIEGGGDVVGNGWLGASVRGCGRVWRLCLGAAGRAAGDFGNESVGGRHIAIEFLALAAVPLRVGPVWLTPSFGFGVAWLRYLAKFAVATTADGDVDSEQDGVAAGTQIITKSADQGRLQTEVRLEVALPLRRSLALCAALSLDAALTGHSPLLVQVPSPGGATGTMGVELTPVPWGTVLGQLGVRWGAP